MNEPQLDGWARHLCGELGIPDPHLPDRSEPECLAWAASGAMAMTGRGGGPPLLAPGSPTAWTQRALDLIAACAGREVGTTRLLGERASIMGLARRSPLSAGGACRLLRAADGWFAISLARPSDHELIPALVQRAPGSADPWRVVEAWLRHTDPAEAQARAGLLGLAAAAVPVSPPQHERPPVVFTRGGPRRTREKPLVVDLSSLWAGPLCAQLLRRAGARVITVESRSRRDGARLGSPSFYARLHAGHESIVLDFASGLGALVDLLRTADVVIEASRPRALTRLGIDADSLVAAGTIWVSVTAYGRTGDAALRIGFGDDVAAGAGLVAFDGDEPCFVGDAIADPLTGVTAAAAAALALRASNGCLLDVSMHHVAAAAACVTPRRHGAVIQTRSGWSVVCGDRQAPVVEARCR